ncbi:NAD-dependent epimerase/dehydratase family protein [Microbacter margulisiae]|uniref:Nucleoside-diphosphate-sugar epimerase n=1 Tax=Microbacter margulisiae TaxID=1350067 RepID=A0A7W5DQI1_9PORP|nr:NAD-dependent epimerase/dehydratase family protein [Microbacter margulisiae]MBB3187210.1 nucleoside-diphosphate-sugar epimerase [Microbacter margulisiae]
MKNTIIQEDIEQICQENLDWTKLSNKNILISGANGMLPSYWIEVFLFLIKQKIIFNTHIFAIVRNEEKANIRFEDYLKESFFSLIVQDICDPINITNKIDIIIHAASQASPKYYGIDPVGTINPNVIGTTNLLKLAKEQQTEMFIFFSSAEVYGNKNTSNAIDETDFGYLDPMNVRSCYAESKRLGETICVSWYKQFNVPVKIIRPFHTYGPGMSPNDGRVFADFVFNILNNQDIIMKSDGCAQRAYCYIKDAVLGYFYVLLNGSIGEAYNVGNPSEEYSVKDLAKILIDLFPEKSLSLKMDKQFTSPGYIPSNINRILPNINKIKNIGWAPKVDIKTGFYRTIVSYNEN